MRFRIKTHAPLPDVKAWFVPDAQNIPESILDLKETLCRRVQLLKDGHYHGKDLVLLLEGFELLNDSSFDAVRDGDLVTIKLSPFPRTADFEMDIRSAGFLGPRKRKRSPERTASKSLGTVLPPALKLKKPAVESSESSSEESDTESDSTSTTSSSSSSTSSSTSSDSSTSAPSSPCKPHPSKSLTKKHPPPKPVATTRASTANSVHVPPGQGKATTHSRNKRRKKKREFNKLAKTTPTPAPPKGISETNNIPLGAPPSKQSDPCSSTIADRDGPAPEVATALNDAFQSNASGPQYGQHLEESSPTHSDEAASAAVYITLDQVAMGSLRNKNKKKGFKLSMNAPIPQKIVFDAEPGLSGLSTDTRTTIEPTTTKNNSPADLTSSSAHDSIHPIPSSASQSQARLVPPSELQDLGLLPPNMFVTSVDVEAGMWDDPSTSKKPKRNKKKKNQVQEDWYGYEREGVAQELSYGEPEDESGEGVEQDVGKNTFDWDRVDRVWEICVVLQNVEQLAVGRLVGWKALDINPKTFSPELMLSVARIVSVPQDTTSTITVRQLLRPAESEAALAFGLGGGDMEGGQEDELELCCTWHEVLQAGWRLIDL